MKKDLNKLSFGELKKEVEKLQQQKETVTVKKKGVWQVGKNYVIRTVTMINTGRLVEVTDDELVLEDACWIADTGRWAKFLSHGEYSEAEPFPEGQVIMSRHSLIDATEWKHDLPRSTK